MSKITWAETGKRTVIQTVSAPLPLEPEMKETTDLDTIMHLGVRNLSKMMNSITKSVNGSVWDRETVQNLKDIMAMLSDLKKREQDLLDSMSDEQLEEINKNGDTK